MYFAAWLLYIVFSILAFPVFNISVMLFSVALSMFGAWLYGYAGALITTFLSIPYHCLLLRYFYPLLTNHTEGTSLWHEAMNPFGITTQLLASGAMALLRQTKLKLEYHNMVLEQTVNERTQELSDLKQYILQNHEASHVLLSHILLDDICESLMQMKSKCNMLANQLLSDNDYAAERTAKLHEMIENSIDVIHNLEFIDRFRADMHIDYASAITSVIREFEKTAGIYFELNLPAGHDKIPMFMQHQLYRITQEAITNAMRHGKATDVKIHLTVENDVYHLSVVNNGHPLPDRIKQGLGLKLIQNRLEQLRGGMELRKTEGGRTQLICRIPQTQTFN